jgi:hypothetical protein
MGSVVFSKSEICHFSVLLNHGSIIAHLAHELRRTEPLWILMQEFSDTRYEVDHSDRLQQKVVAPALKAPCFQIG